MPNHPEHGRRILLIDDHQMLRDGLERILILSGVCAYCGHADNAGDGLHLALSEPWDVILLDIALPDRNGLEVLKGILDQRPESRVVILSMYSAREYGLRAMHAGAVGFLCKATAAAELVQAVREIAQGGRYITTEVAELAIEYGAPTTQRATPTLSDREFQVLCAIGAGMRPSEVASYLGLSPKTVGTYRARVLLKLGLSTTPELIRYAADRGIAG